MAEPGYLIRQVKTYFQVSKWEFDREPTAIYTLRQGPRGWLCNGPSQYCRRGSCKHVKMTKVAMEKNLINKMVMLKESGEEYVL